MSEVNNTPESIDDGIPHVQFTLRVANVQQAPIDDTLSIQGMAADAKATGEAIAGLFPSFVRQHFFCRIQDVFRGDQRAKLSP